MLREFPPYLRMGRAESEMNSHHKAVAVICLSSMSLLGTVKGLASDPFRLLGLWKKTGVEANGHVRVPEHFLIAFHPEGEFQLEVDLREKGEYLKMMFRGRYNVAGDVLELTHEADDQPVRFRMRFEDWKLVLEMEKHGPRGPVAIYLEKTAWRH